MTMARLIIIVSMLLISTSSYATSLQEVDVAWSTHNLYTINLLSKLREIAENEKKNERHKEQILHFTETVNVINERIYDCYMICELVGLDDDRSISYLSLAHEFIKIKQNDITEKIEWLNLLRSLAEKDKNYVLTNLLDEYIELCLDTIAIYSKCNN